MEDPDGYKIELIEEKDAGRGWATNLLPGVNSSRPHLYCIASNICHNARCNLSVLRESDVDNAQLTGLCDRFRGFYPVVMMLKQPDLTPKPMRCLRLPPYPENG